MKGQAFNPFLPLWEYIPDGEPHVFGDRLYLYGSHDTEGGDHFCAEKNYVCWSAPVGDLSDWRFEGIIYESSQDPRSKEGFADLYAPDVVRGNDGRYYLYYCLSGGLGDGADTHNTPIGVAVCDTPAGRYQYYGFVKNPDGSPYLRYLPHDPAVINDDGVIRLYHGYAISTIAGQAHGGRSGTRQAPDLRAMEKAQLRQFLAGVEQMMFQRPKEQLLQEPEDIMGANHVVLDGDMLTVISETSRIVPGQLMAYGTCFEGHGFYEASSIRKIGDTYYFIYSDENSNMLSYATSKYPDRDFVYRGILQSNGDVGLDGRKSEDRVNMTANNHGSLECVNGQWYIFYHRYTHRSTYSRQACAERVTLHSDGSIRQAECTSCGLNGGPLIALGVYPAAIACNITNGQMPHIANRIMEADIPYVTHSADERYITNIKSGTRIVFKYFAFDGPVYLELLCRGKGSCAFAAATGKQLWGKTDVPAGTDWCACGLSLGETGTNTLELRLEGDGTAELQTIAFRPVGKSL